MEQGFGSLLFAQSSTHRRYEQGEEVSPIKETEKNEYYKTANTLGMDTDFCVFRGGSG